MKKLLIFLIGLWLALLPGIASATLPSSTVKNVYAGAGATGPFAFTFPVFSAADITAIEYDSSGNSTTLSQGVDYTVSGLPPSGEGTGNVTLASALPTGSTLLLIRTMGYLQGINFTPGVAITSGNLNSGFDKLDMQIQQLAEGQTRSFQLPPNSSLGPLYLAPAAGQLIGWNADGTGLINYASAPSGGGSGNLNSYGTPTQYQWGWFNDATHVGGVSVTANKVACSDSSGLPVACTNLTDSSFSLYAPLSSPTFTGTVKVPITGSTQCLHVSSTGAISGTGSDCGTGGGGMTNPMTDQGQMIYGGSGGTATALSAAASTSVLLGGTTPAWSAYTLPAAVAGSGYPLISNGTNYVAGTSAWAPTISGANITGLPVSTGVSGLGTGVATAAGNNLGTAGGFSTTIASGTASLGTSAISSGACATVVQSGGANIVTTDVIGWSFSADPTSTTGYQPSANGMLTIIVYPTAGYANFKVCNNTAASITPGAATLNWRVAR